MLTVKPKIEPVSAAFKREQGLVGLSRYVQALALLESLLARSDLTRRQRFEAICRKADCLEHLRRPATALDLLLAATREFSDEALGYSLLGEFLYRIRGDSRAALRALHRAVRLQPKDAESLWWMGQIYSFGLGQQRKGRRYMLAALAADPEYGPAMESLAILAEVEAKWIEAIDWRKSHYRRAHQASALVALSDLYLRIGNASAARKYARQAVRRLKDNRAAAWLALAKALVAEGRPRHALAALQHFHRLANQRAGPFVTTRDFAYLEPVLRLREGRRILAKLPVQ